MVAALIHTINEEFGLFTFATMSTYFSIAGAVAQRRAHPVERLRRRKCVFPDLLHLRSTKKKRSRLFVM